jgi:hypothetical protein
MNFIGIVICKPNDNQQYGILNHDNNKQKNQNMRFDRIYWNIEHKMNDRRGKHKTHSGKNV